MQASLNRIRVVGVAGTLRAMRKWLAISPPAPVRFQPIAPRRPTPVIRLEQGRDWDRRRPAP